MIEKVIENALKSMQGEFSVVLKDLKSGIVYFEKDADRQVPSASTIKILVMIEAFRKSLLGKLDLDGKVKIKKDEKVDFSIITEMNTDEYLVRDLIILMMTISDNTATNVLIDLLGMDDINNTGAALGLRGTVLQRKMMDFEAAKQGRQNLTTPMDMLRLVEKLYRNDILTPKACGEMLKIMSTKVGRDYMIRDLPADIRVAHKPGELNELNHDIGIVYTPACDYALGIFATGLKDNIMGRRYIAELSREIFDHIYKLGGIE
ncbi:MAG: serine hydrolase [Caulobacteraceae bacterium]